MNVHVHTNINLFNAFSNVGAILLCLNESIFPVVRRKAEIYICQNSILFGTEFLFLYENIDTNIVVVF